MKPCIQTALLCCLLFEPVSVTAQRPDGGAAGSARRPGGTSASSPALDRRASQVQQRLQSDRVNSQLRSQAQDRRRKNSQQRAQVEARRAAEIALAARRRTASDADLVPNAEGPREKTGLRRGASDTARELAGKKSLDSPRGTGARIGIQAGVAVPPGLTEDDVRIFDDLFGSFNPFLPERPEAMPEELSRRSGDSRSPGKGAEMRRQKAPEGIENRIQSNLDFADRIRVAARQRRAEISQMRDEAIAKGRPELLNEADQIETRLNAFAEAQVRLQAEIGAVPRTATADSPPVE